MHHTTANPDSRDRRSVRLRGYDYTQASGYFVTICTYQRECLFGEIVDREMRVNDLGRIAERVWLHTADVRPNIMLDAFVVMPNHIHGIIALTARVTATESHTDCVRRSGPLRGSLGAIMGQFKSIVTKTINRLRGGPEMLVWQRSYFEHIIRNENDLRRIRDYIENNPARWAEDENNPANL
jgi:REP element-mobilizing transposase RayT